jgi:hypothetical protein
MRKAVDSLARRAGLGYYLNRRINRDEKGTAPSGATVLKAHENAGKTGRRRKRGKRGKQGRRGKR